MILVILLGDFGFLFELLVGVIDFVIGYEYCKEIGK